MQDELLSSDYLQQLRTLRGLDIEAQRELLNSVGSEVLVHVFEDAVKKGGDPLFVFLALQPKLQVHYLKMLGFSLIQKHMRNFFPRILHKDNMQEYEEWATGERALLLKAAEEAAVQLVEEKKDVAEKNTPAKANVEKKVIQFVEGWKDYIHVTCNVAWPQNALYEFEAVQSQVINQAHLICRELAKFLPFSFGKLSVYFQRVEGSGSNPICQVMFSIEGCGHVALSDIELLEKIKSVVRNKPVKTQRSNIQDVFSVAELKVGAFEAKQNASPTTLRRIAFFEPLETKAGHGIMKELIGKEFTFKRPK